MVSPYPYRGMPLWDDDLKEYIDSAIDEHALSDTALAHVISTGSLTQGAIGMLSEALISRAGAEPGQAAVLQADGTLDFRWATTAPGPPGATMIVGSGAPYVTGVQNGQAYLDGASGELWTWSSAGVGSWTDTGETLMGPQGIQGIQGIQGNTGADGPQGIQGVQGIQGNSGQPTTTGAGAPVTPGTQTGQTYLRGSDGHIWSWNGSTWVDTGTSLIGPTGPAGIVWRGNWVAATAYAVGDGVYRPAGSYRRIVAGTTATAPESDATNWAPVALKGADGTGAVNTVNGVAPTSGDVGVTKTLKVAATGNNTAGQWYPIATYTLTTASAGVQAQVRVQNSNYGGSAAAYGAATLDVKLRVFTPMTAAMSVSLALTSLTGTSLTPAMFRLVQTQVSDGTTPNIVVLYAQSPTASSPFEVFEDFFSAVNGSVAYQSNVALWVSSPPTPTGVGVQVDGAYADDTRFVMLTGTQTVAGAKTFTSPLQITQTGAANDTNTVILSSTTGADGTLGGLLLAVVANPSATAGNRYVSIYAGDSLAVRPLILNKATNIASYGNVGIGLTTPTAPLHIYSTNAANTVQIVQGRNAVATVNNKALTSNVATLATAAAHGFIVGRRVTVTNVDATFNGTYVITAIGDSTHFSYAKTAADVASTAATGSAQGDVQTANITTWTDGSGTTVASVGPTGAGTFNGGIISTAGASFGSSVTATALTINGASSWIEIGRVDGTASTPFIDFHSGATAVDYDARIVASGGSGAVGGGGLQYIAATHNFNTMILIGSASAAPTHNLTLTSSTSGYAHYNTSDQTTNYERARMFWSSNVFTLAIESGGTGTARSIALTAQGQQFTVGPGAVARRDGTGSVTPILQVTSTGLTSASNAQVGLIVDPVINQSGTAGYTAIKVNVTETAVGSGANYLLDLRVGNASLCRVENTGALKQTITAAGTAYAVAVTGDTNSRFVISTAGAISWGPGNAAVDTFLYRNSAGQLKTDGSFVATRFAALGVSGQNALNLVTDDSVAAISINNTTAAAAGVGSSVSFFGVSAITQGIVRAAWTGAATTDSYLTFQTRVANVITEGMRLTGTTLNVLGQVQENGVRVYSSNNKPTPAALGAEPAIRVENNQTGAYTLALTDVDKIVTIDSASNVTLTVPTNATVAIPIGTVIQVECLNTGDVTIGGAGITFQSAGGKLKLTDQWAVASIRKVATDTWRVYGNLTL